MSLIFTPLQNLRAAEPSEKLETGQQIQKFMKQPNFSFLLIPIDILVCIHFLSETSNLPCQLLSDTVFEVRSITKITWWL